MIQNSFILLESINKKTEQNIWKQGIYTWDDFIKAKKVKGISNKRKPYYDRKLLEARKALYNLDSSYFIDKLPQSETWRLYDFFREDAVFLDIETSGLNIEDDIMVIGLFDGINTKVMIKGINMDIEALKKELINYKIIITYNGSSFDIPFIKKRYPSLLPEIPHIDLRVACSRVGLTGGLKEIERILDIRRNKIIEKLYGGDVLSLWKMFRASGDDYYLNLLVEYNEEDVINLKTIANFVVNKLKNDI
jgi:hypothetical protein